MTSSATSSLSDLIARLERATSGDRLLDAMIECEARRFHAYAVGLNDEQRSHWKPVGTRGEVVDGPTRYHAPTYSFSIDAAMTLVPEGWNRRASETDKHWWWAELREGHETSYNRVEIGQSPSLPVSICIAALRARSLPAI